MDAGDFDMVFQALETAKIRYLVVGGVAVVLHGYPRFTGDIDLVLSLERANVLAAVKALGGLGYKPRAPVHAEDFADPAVRRSWVEEKGLTVFSLWSPSYPATDIDVFVEEPFPFDEAYGRALHAQLEMCVIHVASIADLIDLKQRAGRPKDLEDIRMLRALEEDGEPT